MNWKTTVVLLLLTGACAALFWKGPELAPRLGLASKTEEKTDAGTTQTLAELPVNQVTRIVIEAPGQLQLELKSPGPGQPLELLGNWPVRRSEVETLLNTLRDLKSRYYPIPMDSSTNLESYGLAASQQPIVVTLTAADKLYRMKFGEPPLNVGQSPLTRPSYVLLEGKNEILRLGPQVLPILRRGEETYRRRQLFPEAERVRMVEPKPAFPRPDMEDAPPEIKADFLLSNAAKKVVIDSPSGQLALEREAPQPKPEPPADKPDGEPVIEAARLAKSWMITAPLPDHIDPDKLRGILTALPNLWVEKFVDAGQRKDYSFGLGNHPELELLTFASGAIPAGLGGDPLILAVNFAAMPEGHGPNAKVTVRFEDGKSPRTLQIGRVSRTINTNELRFAKIEDNPQIFELKVDRLSDLQMNLGKASGSTSPFNEVRDLKPVRFDSAKVKAVEIDTKKSSRPKEGRIVKLEKSGSDWRMVEPDKDEAVSSEVSDLISKLHDMQAQRSEIVDVKQAPYSNVATLVGMAAPTPNLGFLAELNAVDPVAFLGLKPDQAERITLTFDFKGDHALMTPDEIALASPITVLVGRPTGSNKRAVMVEGSNRINLIDDHPSGTGNVSRFDREPSAYRQLKLFDLGSRISEVTVKRKETPLHEADSYTLKRQQQKGRPNEWVITAPVQADADDQAGKVVRDLRQISSAKYVYDPKTDDLLVVPERWTRFLLPLGAQVAAFDSSTDAFFGLDKPALTFALKFDDPKKQDEVIVEVGRPRSPTEYYARRKGSSALFLISDLVVKSADQRPEKLVDHSLLALNGVRKISRSMNKQEFELVLDPNNRWEIGKPEAATADQTTVEEFVGSLRQLRASIIEPASPKLKPEYGLDPPVAVVTIDAEMIDPMRKTEKVERILEVGSPVVPSDPNGFRYVKVRGSTIVAVISGEVGSKLIASPSRFRDLEIVGFTKADRIVVQGNDRKAVFIKEGGKWKMKEPVEGEADDRGLRELYDTVGKFRADRIVEEKPKDLAKYGLDKPEHWQFFDGDREVMHLLLGKKSEPDKKADGFRYYAKLLKASVTPLDRDTVVLLEPRLSEQLAAEYGKAVPPGKK